MAHIADGPTENCIPSCSLPVCVSLWGQWLSYKWINNPKAKVNSLRTILKRSFSLAFMRANFYSPNANSQFSCICILRQVRRESDHFDYFPVSFFGFQCARGTAETSLQVVILSHHRNWSTFWPKLVKNWPKRAVRTMRICATARTQVLGGYLFHPWAGIKVSWAQNHSYWTNHC